MLRVWRYFWITTAALLGLLLLSILLLPLIISQLDPNQFKNTIETQVSELTGRQLKIDGNLQIDFSMQPSIRVEKVSFANAPWGKQPLMLSLESLQLKIRLLPLLKNKLVVEQLFVEGLDLSIETDSDGRNNWLLEKFAGDESDTVDLAANQATNQAADTTPFQLPLLPVLKQVQLDAIHIDYSDATEDIETGVVIENLQLANNGIDEPFTLSATGAINQYPFSISGGSHFLTTVTTQNLLNQGLSVRFNANALGISLTANGKIEHPTDAEGIDVKLTLDAPDLDKSFTEATGKSIYEYLRKNKQPLTLSFSTNITDINDGDNYGYHLKAIALKLAGNDVGGDLSFINHPDRPKIVAKLNSEDINLNQLLAETTEPTNKTSKKNTLKQNGGAIKLPDSTLPFDLLESVDADITYSIKQFRLDSFTPHAIKLSASLHDAQLDIKRFDFDIDGAPVRSSLSIDSRPNTPKIKISLNIKNFQLDHISQHLQPNSKAQTQLRQIKSGIFQSTLKLDTKGKSIKAMVVNLNGKANIQLLDVTFEQQLDDKNYTADIEQLAIDFYGINEPLDYKLKGAIDKKPLLMTGQLDSPAAIIKNKPIKLKLRLAALKAQIDAEGSIPEPLDPTNIELAIALDIPRPKATNVEISYFIPGVKTNRHIADLPTSLHTDLTVTPDLYQFKNILLKVGSNDVSGKILADLRGNKPFIDATLRSKLIDLNEFVPTTRQKEETGPLNTDNKNDNKNQTAPSDKKKPEKATPENAQRTGTEKAPGKIFSKKPLPALDALGDININLVYTLDKLISNEQVVDNISLKLQLKDSLLSIDPLSIKFSNGTFVSRLKIDAVDTPRFHLEEEITNLDYGHLMTILGIKQYAQGKLDAEINLKGEGNSVSELMASMDGMFRVTTVNGELDSDSLKLLSKDLVSILPFTDTSDRQKIHCGIIQFDINKGIASTHAMVFNTGAVSALGTGDIDLANEEYALYFAPRSKRTSLIKLALVPVNITGPLSDPTIKPDITGSTISTTKTAANISLTIATGGYWLLAEGFTNDLWDKFVDDTDYCARALAGDKIVPRRIQLEEENAADDNIDDPFDDEYNW